MIDFGRSILHSFGIELQCKCPERCFDDIHCIDIKGKNRRQTLKVYVIPGTSRHSSRGSG